MKALVIVAHGSKRDSSNIEVLELMSQLRKDMQAEYPIIVSAFLEFASPSIPEAIKRCQQQGATAIKVLPYFLSAGKHVHEDIPAQTHEASAGAPQLEVEILPHLGSRAESMVALMRGMVAG